MMSRSGYFILFPRPPSGFYVVDDRESILVVVIAINQVDVLDVTMILCTYPDAGELKRVRILIGALLQGIPNDELRCEVLGIVEPAITGALILNLLEEQTKLIQTTGLSIWIAIIVDVDV
jgi:hypothetical protein